MGGNTKIKKKKRFEEEGDIAIPQKNRPFKLKERMVIPEAPKAQEAPKAPEVRNAAQDKFQLLDKGIAPTESLGNADTFPKMNARNGFVGGDTDETGLDKAYNNSSNLFVFVSSL